MISATTAWAASSTQPSQYPRWHKNMGVPNRVEETKNPGKHDFEISTHDFQCMLQNTFFRNEKFYWFGFVINFL